MLAPVASVGVKRAATSLRTRYESGLPSTSLCGVNRQPDSMSFTMSLKITPNLTTKLSTSGIKRSGRLTFQKLPPTLPGNGLTSLTAILPICCLSPTGDKPTWLGKLQQGRLCSVCIVEGPILAATNGFTTLIKVISRKKCASFAEFTWRTWQGSLRKIRRISKQKPEQVQEDPK